MSFGEIPNDWDELLLKDMAEVIDGDRSSNYPSGDDIVKEGKLFLSTKNIIDSFFNFNEVRFITEEKFNSIKKGKLKKDDLVITMRGSIGSVARFSGEQFDTALINAQMSIIRPISVNSDYLWSALNSIIMPRYLKKITSGSAQPQLTKKDVEKIPVILPTLPEQKKIASILSIWDKAIELKEKLIEQKKEQKKGLMQRLLTGEVRLPGFDGEWQEVALGEITDISTGKKDNQDKVEYGKYPFFVRSENVERINSYSFDGEAILIPGDGRIGQIYHYIVGKFDYHQRVYKISDFSEISSGKFIYFYLSQFFHKEAIRYSAKATVDSLRLPMLTGMKIKLPALAEQNEIVGVLNIVDKEISLLEENLIYLKRQKQGLMQLLLTGKVRVKV